MAASEFSGIGPPLTRPHGGGTGLALAPGSLLDGALIPPMTAPTILLEDDSLVALDKPEGLPVSPPKGGGACVMDFVRERFGRQAANVHRLEEDASGVVLCAKTKEALDFLSGQFQSKTVGKTFNALVAVLPSRQVAIGAEQSRAPTGSLAETFRVDLPLGDDHHRPGLVRVVHGRAGRPAETDVTLLEPFGKFAWLECRPLSGRIHQVRAHLSACGAPVLNDSLYGDASAVLLLSSLKRGYKGRDEERPLITRLALHARGLVFVHPVSRLRVEVRSPLPREFEIALKYLRRFAGERARKKGA